MSWNKILTPKQLEIANDIKLQQPRLVIFEGAVRSGKTILGIDYWNALVSGSKSKLYIMTGQTISSLKRNVLDEITKNFGIDTHLNMSNEFEMYGNKIACFGTDKSDSFKTMHGLTSAGWYANEITLSHQNSVLEGFARCSDPESRIIWETNPDKHMHYIRTDYILKSGSKFENGKNNIISYHFNLEDNTYLDQNYIESLKQSIPLGTYYDRMILGLWKASDKTVYNNYDFIDRIPDQSKWDDYAYGLDFGWTNPSALVRVIWIDGELYIEPLLYESRLTKELICNELNKNIQDKSIPIYCDHDKEKIAYFRENGFNCIEADKSAGSVMAGINKVRGYKLHILDDMNFKVEIENYELRANAQGEVFEEPVKFNDHLLDATRMTVFCHNYVGKEKASTNYFEEINNKYSY